MHKVIVRLIAVVGVIAPAVSSAAEPKSAALDRAARDFRIKVYESFRETRDDYDRWREAGDKLLKDWKDSARTTDEQHQVVDWYVRAAESIEDRELPELPELPRAAREKTRSFSGATLRSEPAETTEDVLRLEPAIEGASDSFGVPVLNRRSVEQFADPIESEFGDESAGGDNGFSFDTFDSPNPFEDTKPFGAPTTTKSKQGGSNLLDSLKKAVLGGETKPADKTPADAAPIDGDLQ